MESNTKHLINCDSRSTKEYSLLMLNDHCLIEIFELLQPYDFINLANTCNRLYSVALDAAAKFKDIEFMMFNSITNDKVTRSCDQFSDTLSLLGGHVKSIKILYGGSDVAFEMIKNNCEKLHKLELYSVAKLPSQHFHNLRELKVYGRLDFGIEEFRNVFTSNPNIESLEVVDVYNTLSWNTKISKFFTLLQLLPKLRILELDTSDVSKEIKSLLSLSRLPHLTKLSLHNLKSLRYHEDDSILIELATKSNLLELELDSLESKHLHIIKLFQNLEVLHLHICYDIPESTDFPPKLKVLHLSGTSMSCSDLITIVKQLKFLEVFDMGGNKIWYRKDDKVGNYQSEIVCRIVDQIGKRNVKIIFPDASDVDDYDDIDGPYLHNSNHLQIIRNRFWLPKKGRKPARTPTVFLPV